MALATSKHKERRRNADVAHQLRRLGQIETAAGRGAVIGREGERVLGGKARDTRCRQAEKKSYGGLS